MIRTGEGKLQALLLSLVKRDSSLEERDGFRQEDIRNHQDGRPSSEQVQRVQDWQQPAERVKSS